MKPIRKTDLLSEELGDELLLCNTKAERIHVLNATAKLVWELCDGEHTLDDMEKAVRARFDVAPDQDVRADLERTLAEFASKGLLVEAAP